MDTSGRFLGFQSRTESLLIYHKKRHKNRRRKQLNFCTIKYRNYTFWWPKKKCIYMYIKLKKMIVKTLLIKVVYLWLKLKYSHLNNFYVLCFIFQNNDTKAVRHTKSVKKTAIDNLCHDQHFEARGNFCPLITCRFHNVGKRPMFMLSSAC